MSMYIRVKRKKMTVFLQVEPTETVLEVKHKLQKLLEQPPDKQQLFRNGVLMEDAKKLVDLRVENDDVVGLALQQEDGKFEELDITPFQPREGGS